MDDGTSIAPDQDLWAFIGDELKMGIPENSRIREQKQSIYAIRAISTM